MGVVDGPVVHHFPHRQLHYLAGLGARNGVHLQDAGRHVAGGAVLAHLLADALAQRLVQLETRLELDEQHNPLVLLPLLADDDALFYFLQLLDVAVNLAGADAHAPRVEGGVGAAVEQDATGRGQLDPVAVAPDVVEPLEIGGVVLVAAVVSPETDGLGRERLGADQLALFTLYRLARFVEYLYREAEAASLAFATVDGADGVADDKTGADVGAT